jgi:hypothetical protein
MIALTRSARARKRKALEARVRDWLLAHPHSTFGQIMDGTGLNGFRAQAALFRLIRQSRADYTINTRHLHVYRATD